MDDKEVIKYRDLLFILMVFCKFASKKEER